jgi:hypothetical protein
MSVRWLMSERIRWNADNLKPDLWPAKDIEKEL